MARYKTYRHGWITCGECAPEESKPIDFGKSRSQNQAETDILIYMDVAQLCLAVVQTNN